MDTLETRYGTLSGISNFSHYDCGALRSCMLHQENVLTTPVGELIPQYRVAEYGERQKKHRSSLDFFENGQIKSAALETATPITTPLGIFKAELVTFYEDGSLNRLFPLNGLVDGFWSEKKEGELAEYLNFDLPVGKFRAKIINMHFYRSGALKSLTLWPGQMVSIDTPIGPMRIRTGFSLYEDGSLRSAEPATATDISTPIGRIKAFDAEMLGMNADKSSVQFCPAGKLRSVKTIHTGLRVKTGDAEAIIEPVEASSLINFTGMRTIPMQIDFDGNTVAVIAKDTHRFDTSLHSFRTFERMRIIRDTCGSACPSAGNSSGGCSGCDGGPSCCKNTS